MTGGLCCRSKTAKYEAVLSSRSAPRVPLMPYLWSAQPPDLTFPINLLTLCSTNILSPRIHSTYSTDPLIMSHYGGPPQNQYTGNSGGYYDQQGQGHYPPQGHSPQPQQGYYPPEVSLSRVELSLHNPDTRLVFVSSIQIDANI